MYDIESLDATSIKESQEIIEWAYQNLEELNTKCSKIAIEKIRSTVNSILIFLQNGKLRVAEKINNEWQVNQWLKKAILLFFKLNDNYEFIGAFTKYFDKIPVQFANYTMEDFSDKNARIVPPACIRHGAYIGKDTVLMPSYVNIGAYVDDKTMVDTWATIGSCAQIGKNVHISGGTGIGGVLEPLQASPTIIEDNCFIGARSEIVEGVIVEEGSVISMGVFIGKSTKIYDREQDKIIYGRVPSGSVVVPGTLPSSCGKYSLGCAVIVKKVDSKTLLKTSINEILRRSELV